MSRGSSRRGGAFCSWLVRPLAFLSEREETAENILILALCILLVSMVVMVNVKGDPVESPGGNFFCNCTVYNLAGSTSDYNEDCNAQCRPTMAAVETSGATAVSMTGMGQPTMAAVETSGATAVSTTGVGVHETTLHLAFALLGAVLPWLY